MTRTLILYINHGENTDPNEMTYKDMNNLITHVQNYLCSHGFPNWKVDGEFEDE